MWQKGSQSCWYDPTQGIIEAGIICSDLLDAISSAGAALTSTLSRITKKAKKKKKKGGLIPFSQLLTFINYAY